MPDAKTLSAVLDAVDVGMALVGSDRRIRWSNAAYADFLGCLPKDLEGASVFASGCPCDGFRSREPEWDRVSTMTATGKTPDGTAVEVVVRPVTAESRLRLVVVRRGFVRYPSGRRLPPEVVEEMSLYLTELTGHAPDAGSIGVSPVSILMFEVNDLESLRTRVGDDGIEGVLRQVARALVLQKRKVDIVCRYRDTQFLVIAPETPRHGASILVQRIAAGVAALGVEVDGRPLEISLRTFSAEYRPAFDGPLRDAVVKASRTISGDVDPTTPQDAGQAPGGQADRVDRPTAPL